MAAKLPTKALEASGQLSHNKKRYENRANEPTEIEEITSKYKCPECLVAAGHKKRWDSLVSRAHKGSLATADRETLIAAVYLTHEFETSYDDIQGARINAMIKILQELGMTPVSRSKLQVRKSEKTNDFDDL
jgi:hypothetical protein